MSLCVCDFVRVCLRLCLCLCAHRGRAVYARESGEVQKRDGVVCDTESVHVLTIFLVVSQKGCLRERESRRGRLRESSCVRDYDFYVGFATELSIQEKECVSMCAWEC